MGKPVMLREVEENPLTRRKEEVQVFESGAQRSRIDDDLRYDLIPMDSLKRIAMRYGLGARKYGANNYQKGMPVSAILNHMLEHFRKFQMGEELEDDHWAAIGWAAMTMMWIQDNGPDLINKWREGYD